MAGHEAFEDVGSEEALGLRNARMQKWERMGKSELKKSLTAQRCNI